MDERIDTRGINGIRGIGAIGIAVFAHYYFFLSDGDYYVDSLDTYYPFYNTLTYWFWNYATYLVDLFFVISGFVIVYTYRDRIKNGSIRFIDFIKKRLVRFYPLMVFALFVILVLQLIHTALTGRFFIDELIFDNSILTFILNLLCLQGTSLMGCSYNTSSWYLSTLLFMYILFYVATYFAGRYNYEKIAYLAMVVMGIVIAVEARPVVFLNSRGMISFFTGCLLYDFVQYTAGLKNSLQRRLILAFAFVLLAVICAIGIRYGHAVFAKNTQVIVVYELLIWPLCVFLTVLVRPVCRLLSLKPLEFLGKISFSMYLIHLPLIVAIDDINVIFSMDINYSSRKVFLIYVVLAVIVSTLCHYFVEKPMTRFFKGRIYEKKL